NRQRSERLAQRADDERDLGRDCTPGRIGHAKALEMDDLVPVYNAERQARQARRLHLLLHVVVNGREIGRGHARRSSARKRRERQRQQGEDTAYGTAQQSSAYSCLHVSPLRERSVLLPRLPDRGGNEPASTKCREQAAGDAPTSVVV